MNMHGLQQNGTNYTGNITTSMTSGTSLPALKMALDITLVTLLVIIMLAMGCVLTWADIWKHIRRPTGIIIGMTSQFILLPLVGFGLAHALQLSPIHSIGLLVLTCSPGGTTSNLFCYLSDGDVSLSIVMTTVSTMLALGMMPVNLLIYSSSWTSDTLIVPYGKIAITLVFILIPVAVGMVVRNRFPKIATLLTKIGSIAGMAAILSAIIMQGILYPSIFKQSWHVWFASVALPMLGFSVGMILSIVTCQMPSLSRTIAIETGAQNVSLALTVLLLSFPLEAQEDISIIPMLFGIFVMIEGFLVCFLFKAYSKHTLKGFQPVFPAENMRQLKLKIFQEKIEPRDTE